MNLTEMSVDDLRALLGQLGHIADAAGRIEASLRLDVVISIVPGREAVIRTGWTMPAAVEFGPPPPFVLEPAADPAPVAQQVADVVPPRMDPEPFCRFVRSARSVTAAVAEAVPEAAAEAVPEAVTAVPVAPLRAEGAEGGEPILGPMTDGEKAVVREMAARGLTAHEIAKETRRRVQTIASILRAKKSDAGQPAEAGVGHASGAVAGSSLPVSDAGETPVLCEGGGESGPCAAANGVSQSAAPKAGGAAPLPQMLPRQRVLYEHLVRVGYRKGWDARADLDLVEALAAGVKLPVLCADMGWDQFAAHMRFEELSQQIRDDRGRVTIDGQKTLLEVLRIRAEVQAQGR